MAKARQFAFGRRVAPARFLLFAAIVLALLVICPQGVSGLIERGWNALRRKAGGAR